MKRIASLGLAGMLSLSMLCSTAFAVEEAVSIYDIGSEQTGQTEVYQGESYTQSNVNATADRSTLANTEDTESSSGSTSSSSSNTSSGHNYSSTTQSDREFINNLQGATDMTGESETVEKAAQPMVRIVSIIVQIICYVITAGMALRVALDLCYIALPFTRTFLANGHVGNPQAGTPGGMNGMNQGMGMGGMGMGGMGMGSYGGMGFGGYGRGMGMGMGGMGMGGMRGMSSPGSFDQGSASGSIQWVSTAALNAVASEATVDQQTGKPGSAFKIYVKDMSVVLILTPILLVLAISGTLTNLGFLIGDILCNTISKLSF